MTTRTVAGVASAPDPPGPRSGTQRRLRGLLHEHGLRCTAQRLVVLRILDASCGHLTALVIHQRVLVSGDEVDITTVYRTLTTLADVGLVHAIAITEQAASYGLATNPHHHALCTQCGQLSQVPAEQLSAALDQARRASRFGLDDSSMMLRGLCPRCLDTAEPILRKESDYSAASSSRV